MAKDDDLGIEDSSGLTDADWTEINKLKRAHDEGGAKALSSAMEKLFGDPVRAIRVIGAFFPRDVTEAIRDVMAERGITREDLQEIIEKSEAPKTKQ